MQIISKSFFSLSLCNGAWFCEILDKSIKISNWFGCLSRKGSLLYLKVENPFSMLTMFIKKSCKQSPSFSDIDIGRGRKSKGFFLTKIP